MVHFVGAGPGAPDLITLRGRKFLDEADVVIYAGSLVNPGLLKGCRKDCEIFNSAHMTLEEVTAVMERAEKENKMTVRLHTGDPSLYGAIKEQMDLLEKKKIPYDVCPGVSSFCGAAAALRTEYTLPEISQSVVITRMEGRTKVPEKEQIEAWAVHQSTMVIFLSAGLLPELERRLMEGGYPKDTPAAIVYKASWPEQKVVMCRLCEIAESAKKHGIAKTALIVVGRVLDSPYERSKLYDPAFATEFRAARKDL